MQFDEPDEEEEGEGRNVTYEVRDEDEPDAEEDMGVENDYDGQLKTADGMDEYEDKKSGLHPREIDAHWIQRSLAKLAGYDADEAQRKAKTVLGILGVSTLSFLTSWLFDLNKSGGPRDQVWAGPGPVALGV